jgi:hypothetical protein
LQFELLGGSFAEVKLENGTWPVIFNILKLLIGDSKR